MNPLKLIAELAVMLEDAPLPLAKHTRARQLLAALEKHLTDKEGGEDAS